MARSNQGIENQRPEPANGECALAALEQQSRLTHPSSYAFDKAADLDATIHNSLVSDLKQLSFNSPKKVLRPEEKAIRQGNDLNEGVKGPPPADEDRLFERERAVTMQYLLDNVAEFRQLTEIRKKVSDKSSATCKDSC